jgi:predicted nucleotidyltransferase
MEIEEVKKKVSEIIKDELRSTHFNAFFFGSRVLGTNSKTSDLDVGIEGTTTIPENILRSIKLRCASIPTLYTIDIVDFSLISVEFKKVAKSKVEEIK